jgi:uncharacterized protein (TIGR03435 family)
MNVLVSALLNGAILSIPLTVLTWIVLRLTPRAVLNAATRYAILWGVLLVSALLPALYLPRHTPQVVMAPNAAAMSHTPAIAEGGPHLPSRRAFDAEPDVPLSPTHSQILPVTIPAGSWSTILFLVWTIAAIIMLIRLVVSWVLLERRKSEGIAPPEPMACRAEIWLRQCGSKRNAALRLTEADGAGPVATGPWRPRILFPARTLESLSEIALEQIGLHEAAHLARRDDYALTLQRLIEAMFVFHLPIRWLTNQISLEREIACDDFVVRITGRAHDYASCLTRIAESTAGLRPALIAAAVADEKSHLSTRVEMLLNKTRHTGTRLMKLPLCVAGVAMGLLAGAAFTGIPVLLNLAAPLPLSAQTPAPVPAKGPGYPAYVTPGPAAPGTPGSTEPKRVRPANAGPAAPPDGGVQATLKSTPRFTTATITPAEWHMGGASEVISPAGTVEYKMIGIKRLAMLAWPSMQVFRFQWPAWLTEPNGNINAWYDISATFPADTTPDQLRLMIQGLLVDRFQFAAHWETRNTDIYALKIAPDGIKFQKSADPSNPGFRGSSGREGWHILPRLPNPRFPGSGMTLAEFTQDGSAPGLLDRPMVDMTGLDGVYDIDLTIARDPNTPWPMQQIRGPSTATERAKNEGWNNATFFTALESQLGLIAEPETVPLKMLVIDDLELTPTR